MDPLWRKCKIALEKVQGFKRKRKDFKERFLKVEEKECCVPMTLKYYD